MCFGQHLSVCIDSDLKDFADLSSQASSNGPPNLRKLCYDRIIHFLGSSLLRDQSTQDDLRKPYVFKVLLQALNVVDGGFETIHELLGVSLDMKGASDVQVPGLCGYCNGGVPGSVDEFFGLL